MVDTASPYLNQQSGKKTSKTVFIVVAAVIIAMIIGIIYLSRQPKTTSETKTTVVETKEEPTPTERPKIDKETVKIQILNGTGTPGQAGEASDAIVKEGYSADNITTDNAEEFNNLTTIITAREGFEDVAGDMKDALSGIFDEVKVESSTLDESSDYDIVIVTGGKIYEEEEGTPTPTESETTTPTDTPTPTGTSTPTPTP